MTNGRLTRSARRSRSTHTWIRCRRWSRPSARRSTVATSKVSDIRSYGGYRISKDKPPTPVRADQSPLEAGPTRLMQDAAAAIEWPAVADDRVKLCQLGLELLIDQKQSP